MNSRTQLRNFARVVAAYKWNFQNNAPSIISYDQKKIGKLISDAQGKDWESIVKSKDFWPCLVSGLAFILHDPEIARNIYDSHKSEMKNRLLYTFRVGLTAFWDSQLRSMDGLVRCLKKTLKNIKMSDFNVSTVKNGIKISHGSEKTYTQAIFTFDFDDKSVTVEDNGLCVNDNSRTIDKDLWLETVKWVDLIFTPTMVATNTGG